MMPARRTDDGGLTLHRRLRRAGSTPATLDGVPDRSRHQTAETGKNQQLRQRDVEGIEDARRACDRHDERSPLTMGTEPHDCADDCQRNKNLKDINECTLVGGQRAEADGSADSSQKRQAAGRGGTKRPENGANCADLLKMEFHALYDTSTAIDEPNSLAAAAGERQGQS